MWEERGGKGDKGRKGEKGGEGRVPFLRLPVPLQLAAAGPICGL